MSSSLQGTDDNWRHERNRYYYSRSRGFEIDNGWCKLPLPDTLFCKIGRSRDIANDADFLARTAADGLTAAFGQQFFVETHAGAAGAIGVNLVVATPPDGYNFVITNISMLGAMLNREVDASIFDETRRWLEGSEDAYFYLVLDELHLHRGTSGTEVAYLLARDIGNDAVADFISSLAATDLFSKPRLQKTM